MNKEEEKSIETKLSGMFEVYDVFDSEITKLRTSIENVWMIHDREDSLNTSSQEYREKLEFAMHTLFVLRQMFQDEYDVKVSQTKGEYPSWILNNE